MSEISKITISGDLTYDIKDSAARELINGITTSLNSLTTSLSTMAYKGDAPSNDKQYGRKNGDWVEITGGETSGTTQWGTIEGSLSTQIDLQEVLDEKLNISECGGIHIRPNYIISSTDLIEGESELKEGCIYFYYEIEEENNG